MPEASVIRRVQALSGFIGRKAYRRWGYTWRVQAFSSTEELLVIRYLLSLLEGTGILRGGVKSVDTKRNAKGEDKFLRQH